MADWENASSGGGGYGVESNAGDGYAPRDNKCFGCGEEGHIRSDCPNPREVNCRYCKKDGHMVRDCPDKPPMVCSNCDQEGHMKKDCTNARKINRDHIANIDPDAAWEKIKQAARERDIDDAKEAIQEYVKAVGGDINYRALQEGFIRDGISVWLIAVERPLIEIFTNMDLQGNTGRKYTVSVRFSETPERPREAEGWPQNREEMLNRLDDAGDVVDSGIPKCHNCDQMGHTSKLCSEEKMVRHNAPKISCYNCNSEGHRVRDCPQPRVDRNACKNCGKSGHRVADCLEPPNLDNVECRNCNKTGHFSKDCPDRTPMACRNCLQEGHMSKDCTEPRDLENVICRNCDKPGHFSKDCPLPRDWSKVQCTNCQEFGHTKVRCREPPKEAERDFDGGFNGVTADDTPVADTKVGTGLSVGNFDSGGW